MWHPQTTPMVDQVLGFGAPLSTMVDAAAKYGSLALLRDLLQVSCTLRARAYCVCCVCVCTDQDVTPCPVFRAPAFASPRKQAIVDSHTTDQLRTILHGLRLFHRVGLAPVTASSPPHPAPVLDAVAAARDVHAMARAYTGRRVRRVGSKRDGRRGIVVRVVVRDARPGEDVHAAPLDPSPSDGGKNGGDAGGGGGIVVVPRDTAVSAWLRRMQLEVRWDDNPNPKRPAMIGAGRVALEPLPPGPPAPPHPSLQPASASHVPSGQAAHRLAGVVRDAVGAATGGAGCTVASIMWRAVQTMGADAVVNALGGGASDSGGGGDDIQVGRLAAFIASHCSDVAHVAGGIVHAAGTIRGDGNGDGNGDGGSDGDHDAGDGDGDGDDNGDGDGDGDDGGAGRSDASGDNASTKRVPFMYKTVLCENYERDGRCKYGRRCRFAHGVDDLQRDVGSTPAARTPTKPDAAQVDSTPVDDVSGVPRQRDGRDSPCVSFSVLAGAKGTATGGLVTMGVEPLDATGGDAADAPASPAHASQGDESVETGYGWVGCARCCAGGDVNMTRSSATGIRLVKKSPWKRYDCFVPLSSCPPTCSLMLP